MTNQPNILMLAIDSLRADHLGCYGYRRPTSPNIDALAAEGVLAERFICPVIPTWPSFTTVYTGQHPIKHGILQHGGTAQLARQAPHLAHLFLEEGYTTCAIDNLMRERLWFGRGFETYIDPGMRHVLSLTVTAEELNAHAIPWLRQQRDQPFFLLIHYWDPHTPYLPPQRYQQLFYSGDNPTDPANRSLEGMWRHPNGLLARDTWLRSGRGRITDAEYARALYDREIKYVDDAVGQIVTALDDQDLAENTLVVLLGDHGESMTEHGIFFDHYGLYESTLHVPFIARWPGRLPVGVRLPQLLQHTDVAPTLLDAADIFVPNEIDGQSFWPLLTGAAQTGGHERVISVEATWQANWSIRTERYKYILGRDPQAALPRELYDLLLDPQEQHNIASERPDLAAQLESELESWIAEQLASTGQTTDPLIAHGALLAATWQRLSAEDTR